MNARRWISSLAVGVAAGTLVAAARTFLDRQLKPGGIIHDELGTRWTMVAKTAARWFFPGRTRAAAAGFLRLQEAADWRLMTCHAKRFVLRV